MTKHKKTEETHPLPVKTKTLIRVLVLLIIIATYFAGYYHSLFTLERRKYNRLEDMYVRVRMMIGREEMQRLIDESYDLEEVQEENQQNYYQN